MGFLRPKVKTTAAPPPPVIEDTEAKEQEYQDMLRRRKGRASSILTSREGAGQPATASKTLLGS
jgi:hypothetical protein